MADALDLAMRAVAYPVCWSILINGVDDLFIDLNYIFRGLGSDGRRRVTVEDLKAVPQKRLAMMVPAWQEAAVIQQMLELNLKQLDYDEYDIFVGCYQNDPETQAKVDIVARRSRQVQKVIVPRDGPTSKADCLNWVYQHIQLVEERRGQRYDILLMHDAEDIIHPLALRLYNYLIPHYDFVQTPVFPLELPWNAFVGATYKDEFTEHHLKDMLVREQVGGLVPSAGVGSGFDRETFQEIALAHNKEAFNVLSLTEDYELGLKFRLANKNVYFACRAIERSRIVEKGIFRKRKVRVVQDEYIATREFFPDKLGFAIKQRSRWILGIGLQTWEQVGWKGSLPVLYTLMRDRKAILTNFMAVFGYLVAIYCMARMIVGMATDRPWTFDNIFPPGSVLWWIVMANTLVLAWRAVWKYITVDKIYGPVHGVLSLPRFFVSNIINFTATAKAVRQYVHHRITGEPLKWLKTDHVFPDLSVLKTYQRRLGELLQDRGDITEDELAEALDLQDRTGLKLGEIMTLTGVISTRGIADALAEQHALPPVDPDPFAIPLNLLRQVPEADAEIMDVLPLDMEDDETVRVAVSAPPSDDTRTRLETMLRLRVVFSLTSPEALEQGRQRAYRRLVLEEAVGERDRLGTRLVASGQLQPEQIQEALEEQVDTGERLGELLIRRGWVRPEIVSEALANRTDLPFRAVSPDDVDPGALQAIGYGLCALYSLVPLKGEGGLGAGGVASSAPLHEEVRLLITARLGRTLQFYLAPSLDLRCALAVGSRYAWNQGISSGLAGMDGMELRVIEDDPDWDGDIIELRNLAIDEGRSPIDQLRESGLIDANMAARLRARALGVALASPSQLDPDAPHEWLPPGWALRDDLQLVELSPGSLVVAAPRPTPRLARAVAALFPDAAIAWRVSPFHPSERTEGDESEIQTGSHAVATSPGGY
jgi:adsorption protein B